MSVFCRYPFTHLFSDSYHMMMPCCYAVCDHPYRTEENANFKAKHIKDGAYEFYNSEQMKQLRLDMLKSDPMTPLVKDVCRNCIANEESGLPSPRHPLDKPVFGRIIDVKMRIFGNSCNLHCFMCNIKNSTGRIKQTKKMIEFNPKVSEYLGYEHIEKFAEDGIGYDLAADNPDLFEIQLNNLKKLAPKIRSFTIIGGEPFIMPSHYKLLDAMIEIGEAKNIGITYISNMTKLQWEGCKVIDYVKEFKHVEVSWSVEGYGKWNDYMRHPSDWNEIIANIDDLRPHIAKFKSGITLSSLSVIHLDKIVEFCQQNNIDYKFNNVIKPEVCRVDALHPNIRKRLAKKYEGTDLDFLCESLLEEVPDWEQRWSDFLEYTEAIDYVNKTDFREVYPELLDLS